MKKLLLILFIAPLGLLAQDEIQDSIPSINFFLINNEVVYSKVFESDLNKDELIEALNLSLPSINDFEFKNNVSNKYQYNGTFKGSKINTKRYGGTWGNTAIMLRYPIDANAIVQVKDNRYRVVIRNIRFNSTDDDLNYLIDEVATAKRRTVLKHGSNIKGILNYLTQHFTDAFTITENISFNDDF